MIFNLLQKSFLALFIISGLGLVGCAPQQEIRQEINSGRAQAYERWRQAEDKEKQGEPRISGSLSLEDALKLSLTYNQALQAVIEETNIARGRVLASYQGLLPTIALLGSYSRFNDDAEDKQWIASVNEYSAGLEITQPLFRGGATQAEMRSAQFHACFSDARVRGQTEATLYQVSTSYYRVLLAQQLLKVAQDTATSAKAHLNAVSRKRNHGLATEYNVLRARVDVSLYQAEVIQQQNAQNLAKTQLLKDMGFAQDSNVKLSGTLVYRRMQPVFQELVRQAFQNRPDLKQAEANVHISEEAVRLTSSRYWPQIKAFAHGGWARPDPYASSTHKEWGSEAVVGLSLEIPLFDGLQREGQLMENKALLRKRQLELLDDEAQAVLEIRQAVLSIRDAEKFVESQKMNLEYAQEGLRLAEMGYDQGVNTEIDITDARSALTRAMGRHYRAIHDHAIARLNLQKVSGMLAPSDQVGKVNSDGFNPIGASQDKSSCQPAALSQQPGKEGKNGT